MDAFGPCQLLNQPILREQGEHLHGSSRERMPEVVQHGERGALDRGHRIGAHLVGLGGQACHRRLFGCHHAGDQRLAGQFEGTGGCVQGLARMTQDGRIHAAGAGGAGRLAQLAPQRLVRHLEAVTEFLANPAEHAQLGHRVGGYGGLGGFDHGGERRQETAPLRKS